MSINEANELAVERICSSQPVLIGIGTAGEKLKGISKNTVLHAGPPIEWAKMCGPMRSAIIGALVYENIAKSEEEALEVINSNVIKFEPCHHFNAVGPMTGIISYSMPVQIIENKTYGNFSFSTINEGMGKNMRFGANSPEVIEKLRWIRDEFAGYYSEAIGIAGGVNLKGIISQALLMGDEMHMRNFASTTLFIKEIMPYLTEVVNNSNILLRIIRFLTRNNDQFFLNLGMAYGKAAIDAAHGIDNSTLLTAIARNGVEVGIRISGLPTSWFTAPADRVKGLFFPGFTEDDANPDLGDSAVMETVGLGGCAMAASPGIIKIVGGKSQKEALKYTLNMYEVTVRENPDFFVPSLDFRGAPTGIDVRRVVETGITPSINTGIAHKKPGVGQIGAGIASIPISVFNDALISFSQTIKRKKSQKNKEDNQ